MNTKSLAMISLVAILFLFFLQLMSDFVGCIYGLSLLAFSMSSGNLASLFLISPQRAAQEVMIEIVRNVLAGLVLLSPLVLVFIGKRFPTALMMILAEIVIVCRVVEPLLPTRERMLVSGLGVGCFLVVFPLFARRKTVEDQARGSLTFGIGVAFSLMLSILFRTLGRGVDLSTYRWFQAIGWVLGVAVAAMVPGLFMDAENRSTAIPAGARGRTEGSVGIGRITGISLGIIGVTALIYIVLSSPTVIARWTEGNYAAITSVLSAMTVVFVAVAVVWPNFIARMPPLVIWLWNVAFVLTLFLSIAVNQIGFPTDPGSYPIAVPPTTAVQQIPLYLMLLASPVILVDLTLLLRELGRRPPSIRTLGAGFTIASLYFLLLIFAVIFTVIWAYVPGVGPLFRDRLDVIILIGAVAGTAPVLLAGRDAYQVNSSGALGKARWAIAPAAAVLLAGTLVGVVVSENLPKSQPSGADTIKVLTYNIQGGYSGSGRWNFDGQLGVLREQQADIIGLEESDTCRISGGNTDAVRFMANRLHYYSYFGPKTVTGTFGIALLSRYPIENPETFYMWSEGEQTATIKARITIGTVAYHVFVTHLGNYGPMAQQKNILTQVKGVRPVILMGDFNFARDTDQYRVTTAVLEDAWQAARGAGGENNHKKDIDHIFVSPGIAVAGYSDVGGRNSDHQAAVATIRP